MEDYPNSDVGIEEGVSVPTPLYYSDYSLLSLMDNIVYNDYAYLAKDSMLLLDGTQLVLPDDEPLTDIKNCGYIADEISGDTYVDSGNVKGYQYGTSGVTVQLQASGEPFDVTGIFIQFDEKNQCICNKNWYRGYK